MKSLIRFLFKLIFAPLIWSIYRMRRMGLENVPKQGGVLLLSNHVSYIDSFILYYCCPRRVRFVILEDYMRVKPIAWFLRLFEAIPIRPEKAKEAIVRTADALSEGDVVCLFPEGGLTRLGVTTEFKKGFELIVRRADCPVVPVYMDGLFESIFSFERGRFFKKRPHGLTCPLQVAFGPPIPAKEATTERVRLAVWEQSSIAFARRREFDRPLEVALVRGLKRGRRRVLFTEYGKNGPREWTRAQCLALAISIARRWLKSNHEAEQKIGILLPPGPMNAVINLGIYLSGNTPVNLPFTIRQEEIEKMAKRIAPLEIKTVITSQAFMPHLIDFWQGEEGSFIDMKAVISPPGSLMTLFEKVRAMIEPAWLTCWRIDLNRRDREREAVGLVPKPGDEAVFFSANALHQSIRRVYAANFLRSDDILFTEESLSGPEGFVLGCWGPALGRGRCVSRSLSLQGDTELLKAALEEQGVTVLSGSRSFFERLEQNLAVDSVKYALLFGEIEPKELEEMEEKLGITLARAWSWQGEILTMSRPDPVIVDLVRHQTQLGRDSRSVGRFLPGLVARADESRIYVKLRHLNQSAEEWIEGPEKATIGADGFVILEGE